VLDLCYGAGLALTTVETDAYVQVDGLGVVYRAASGHSVEALKGVSLRLPKGSLVAIAGPSGSGKSSLLYVLAGLLRPTSGSARVGNHDLTSMDRTSLARFRCRNVGFIFQSFQLLPHLWAWENVALPMVPLGVPPSERRRRAIQALVELGLATRLTHKPGELSAGEQQRVAMARAIVNSPSLLLADEPTGNLDAANATIVADLLGRLAGTLGATVVCATHDDRLAGQAQVIARMAHGEVTSIEDRR
jgi:putative ABC transport system ATP-binding protein